MNTTKTTLRFTALLLAAALPLFAEDAKPAGTGTTSFSAVVGGQAVNDLDQHGQARFEEFRDSPRAS